MTEPGACSVFELGENGRCVYCDHTKECHVTPQDPDCRCSTYERNLGLKKVEKAVKVILKEWTKYDRLNVQMSSEEEATRLAQALSQAGLVRGKVEMTSKQSLKSFLKTNIDLKISLGSAGNAPLPDEAYDKLAEAICERFGVPDEVE